jgi:hypothetical protein
MCQHLSNILFLKPIQLLYFSFKSMLPKTVPSKAFVEPVCNASFPVTMATFDHLTGVRHRDKIDYRAESALEEALNALIFDKERIDSDEVARYLTYALKNVLYVKQNFILFIAID